MSDIRNSFTDPLYAEPSPPRPPAPPVPPPETRDIRNVLQNPLYIKASPEEKVAILEALQQRVPPPETRDIRNDFRNPLYASASRPPAPQSPPFSQAELARLHSEYTTPTAGSIPAPPPTPPPAGSEGGVSGAPPVVSPTARASTMKTAQVGPPSYQPLPPSMQRSLPGNFADDSVLPSSAAPLMGSFPDVDQRAQERIASQGKSLNVTGLPSTPEEANKAAAMDTDKKGGLRSKIPWIIAALAGVTGAFTKGGLSDFAVGVSGGFAGEKYRQLREKLEDKRKRSEEGYQSDVKQLEATRAAIDEIRPLLSKGKENPYYKQAQEAFDKAVVDDGRLDVKERANILSLVAMGRREQSKYDTSEDTRAKGEIGLEFAGREKDLNERGYVDTKWGKLSPEKFAGLQISQDDAAASRALRAEDLALRREQFGDRRNLSPRDIELQVSGAVKQAIAQRAKDQLPPMSQQEMQDLANGLRAVLGGPPSSGEDAPPPPEQKVNIKAEVDGLIQSAGGPGQAVNLLRKKLRTARAGDPRTAIAREALNLLEHGYGAIAEPPVEQPPEPLG